MLTRVAVVGIPGLTKELIEAAATCMPRLFVDSGIEYSSITPHESAADAAERIVSERPTIILLGYPQAEISAWDIADALRSRLPTCPTILVRINGSSGADAESDRKPAGARELRRADVDLICKAIEEVALPAEKDAPPARRPRTPAK